MFLETADLVSAVSLADNLACQEFIIVILDRFCSSENIIYGKDREKDAEQSECADDKKSEKNNNQN